VKLTNSSNEEQSVENNGLYSFGPFSSDENSNENNQKDSIRKKPKKNESNT
jgi:hypothetical protein